MPDGLMKCTMRDIYWKPGLHITSTVRQKVLLALAHGEQEDYEIIDRDLLARSMRLLGPILKYVDHINTVFGPREEQKAG